jgi:nitroreductase
VLLETATSLGLGAQWVSAVASPYVQTLIKILLRIPKKLEICHMMAVGYPDMVPPPYESTKDIFCFRMERTVDAYRKLSMNKLELPVSGVPATE